MGIACGFQYQTETKLKKQGFCIPLKFGLILASYPEVRPINLSKKSEGDMGLGADRAAASASLEAARLCE